MALATCGSSPWICTVYYVTDESLNLYFVSAPNSKHVEGISKNKGVACAIATSNQKPSENKVGVQMQGEVEEVKGIEKIKWFFKMWRKLNPNEVKLTFENYDKKLIKSKIFRIRPTLIKYMNKELFGDETYKVYKF